MHHHIDKAYCPKYQFKSVGFYPFRRSPQVSPRSWLACLWRKSFSWRRRRRGVSRPPPSGMDFSNLQTFPGSSWICGLDCGTSWPDHLHKCPPRLPSPRPSSSRTTVSRDHLKIGCQTFTKQTQKHMRSENGSLFGGVKIIAIKK